MSASVSVFRRIKTVLNLLRTGISSHEIARRVWRQFLNYFRDKSAWEPAPYRKASNDGSSSSLRVGYFIHIFHPEYLLRVKTLVERADFADFYFTTPKDSIAQELRAIAKWNDNVKEVRKCLNVGRNFGPLLVEFSEAIGYYEVVIHLHSKRSTHMSDNDGARWAQESWRLFDPDFVYLRTLLSALQSDKSIGIAYPVDLAITPRTSFDWGHNFRMADTLGLPIEMPPKRASFMFPAGGMFAARPDAIAPLLNRGLSYADFPQEKGQLDGTTQHAIERLMGIVPEFRGYKPLFFQVETATFTLESPLKYSAL
jgi:lipopolysaccharide biosynthesis protein